MSSPGLLPKQLASAAPTFVSDFRTAYGHAPSVEAIFGYEAMSAVLVALRQAGPSANNRTTVINDFFGIRNQSSPLGTYSIDANGDTSLGASAFVIERVAASQACRVQGDPGGVSRRGALALLGAIACLAGCGGREPSGRIHGETLTVYLQRTRSMAPRA